MDSILFVCLGNICRSPLAHGVAEHIVNTEKLGLFIDSAGTSDWHKGESPCQHSIEIADQYHVDISQQRSRPVSKEDISLFKYVVAMDRQNKADLEAFGFEQVYLIGDFGNYQGEDVPDPYFFDGFEGFDKVYTMISLCVEDFMQRVKNGSL
ncbi:low molecular weight phosphotyrosine protein phosphatase [Sulfurovum sp. XGS-02]|uniref:low molecular weight protein-tyrosine-phosphatase n=1 Tax=Sulfurovum sp. XGS-02 TaxID=2925411 RepID=UPI0020468AC3|nr:low molecular weight protein-tyrosine-phosphatase [Sulfurovum sp. XGS-02]UPT78304.1 low molecular weight phosphotyrosine protein phosphatase [Sulfurovum sp. XGS-02]